MTTLVDLAAQGYSLADETGLMIDAADDDRGSRRSRQDTRTASNCGACRMDSRATRSAAGSMCWTVWTMPGRTPTLIGRPDPLLVGSAADIFEPGEHQRRAFLEL